MFVDIHNHIIPGVDDGAQSEEMTLSMLKIASEEGISNIIATPHYIPGYNEYNNELLMNRFHLVQQLIKDHNLDIKLYLGNELFIDIDAVNVLKDGSCKTLGDSQYVLIELPNRWNSDIIENILYELELKGYKIILAHIERYEYFRKNPKILKEFILRGFYTQVNASSVTSSDRKIKKRVSKLIKKGYVHFISSDAHTHRRRSPRMKDAYEHVYKLIGDKAKELFYLNGQKVINNEAIEVVEPLEYRTRFFLT